MSKPLSLPCDADPEEEGPDLVDLLRRSVELAKGRRHLNPVPDPKEDSHELAPTR